MKRSKITGIVGTVALHVLLLLFLLLSALTRPEQQEESGVPVLLGDAEQAHGDADPYTLTEVEVVSPPEPADPAPAAPAVPEPPVKQPLITQADEPSLKVKKEKPLPPQKKEQQPKPAEKPAPKPTVKPVEKPAEKPVEKPVEKPAAQPAEKTEAEKRAEAERAAAQAAASKIAGAFGKGSQMGDKGTSATGSDAEGTPTGNSDAGKPTGTGGFGTFDLNGRSLGPGGLPKPVYNVQDEGRVVVTIVVNPAGQVISTSINKRTNTVNPALRKAAEEAARKARFNTVSGVNNQSGTITYYFKLK